MTHVVRFHRKIEASYPQQARLAYPYGNDLLAEARI